MVGAVVEDWCERGLVGESLPKAAWLHDIGYARTLEGTGMHAIDGAAYLDLHGVDKEVVRLVAHHTGAWFEAEERSLTDALLQFERPDQDDLDALTLADLVCGPTGDRVTVEVRIQEILDRYEAQHPVHRAVTRSQRYLRKSAFRAASRLGYPM